MTPVTYSDIDITHFVVKKLLRKLKMAVKICSTFLKKTRYIILLLISLFAINVLLASLINQYKYSKISGATSIDLPYVVVHIDLKGNPPKLEYLEYLLPHLKGYGVNALLMEYEDMFPFNPELNLAAKHSYSSNDLRKFLQKAAQLGFEIIPLIQTFGHMEYVLKLKKYQHLRENPLYFDSICPSHPQSLILIQKMLEQVIYFHNNISTLKMIHVGCDEVYHINKCNLCLNKRLPDLDIFMNHLQFVIGNVKRISPNTKILIWDDMLRATRSDIPVQMLHDTEPVYWDYKPQPKISHVDLMQYHRKFKNIWIASAFKGADGRKSVLPNLNNRYLNHYNWMSIISRYKFGGESSVYTFKGIILTGWSRYSHMDAPCELLPASIHSLIMSLLVIKQYKINFNVNESELDPNEFYNKFIKREYNSLLNCNKYGVINNIWCSTNSHTLVDLLKTFNVIDKEIDKKMSDTENGLSAIELNTKRFYINRIIGHNNLEWCKDQYQKLVDLEYKLQHVMTEFYTSNIIKEYIDYLIYPNKARIGNATRILQDYLYKIDSWKMRHE